MVRRLESFGEEVKARLESEEYLALIRKGFGEWDHADTAEKKKLIANLLTNAGATNITSDDVIRLFLDWIETYHEVHFAVIGEIYKRQGIIAWKDSVNVLPNYRASTDSTVPEKNRFQKHAWQSGADGHALK